MTHEVIAQLDVDSQAVETPPSGDCSGGCACGEADADELPELDARAILYGAILGALDGIGSGDGLVLVAPQDPISLLAQLESRAPHTFDVEYLQRGPEAWRLTLTRKGA
jgi:uncharacterized protein (DUF2249 family)